MKFLWNLILAMLRPSRNAGAVLRPPTVRPGPAPKPTPAELLRDKIVEIAKSQVGVREGSENNTGPEIVMYQRATWLTPDAWPWCAAFTCWVLREALLGTPPVQRPAISPCLDASAFGWEKWGAKNRCYLTDESEPAKAGDFVVFDFSHIAIVEHDQGPEDDFILTIEGNTNGKGERDSESGDGVWRKKRATNLVKRYIRIQDLPTTEEKGEYP